MPKKKQKQRPQNNRPRREVPSRCPLCVEKITPDYKEIEILTKFITDRKKILSRSRSGVCSKHQKQLSQAVKRARLLALLPFSVIAR
jgi:small subunit ribosomal protein S18